MQGVVEFDIKTPVHDQGLCDNVTSALSRRLPDVRWERFKPDTVTIVANGPSARHAPLDGPTLALNGALKLFTDAGKAPTYWAACDPQEKVADFLKDAPRSTIYLVGSKCHPAVFEALDTYDIRLWHIDDHATWDLVKTHDPIRSGVSVTICAFELMHRLGYRNFQTWGWDGCYMDGLDHAVPQANGGVDQEIQVGERVFKSTRTWGLEAQDAWNKLRDAPIEIHGGGMIAEIFNFQRAA